MESADGSNHGLPLKSRSIMRKTFQRLTETGIMKLKAKTDVAVSTRNVEKALRALDEGRREDAARELDGCPEHHRGIPRSVRRRNRNITSH